LDDLVVCPVRVRRECRRVEVSHQISILKSLSNIFRIGTHLPGAMFKDIIQTVLWIASITLEETPPYLNPWLHNNLATFPSIWISLINNELMQNHEDLKRMKYPGHCTVVG